MVAAITVGLLDAMGADSIVSALMAGALVAVAAGVWRLGGSPGAGASGGQTRGLAELDARQGAALEALRRELVELRATLSDTRDPR